MEKDAIRYLRYHTIVEEFKVVLKYDKTKIFPGKPSLLRKSTRCYFSLISMLTIKSIEILHADTTFKVSQDFQFLPVSDNLLCFR